MNDTLKTMMVVAFLLLNTVLSAQTDIIKRYARKIDNHENPHHNPSTLTADFSASPTSGNAPLTVIFTDLSTGNPTAWSWNFGDGTTSTQQNPEHTYTNSGIYTVKLTISDGVSIISKTRDNYISVIESSGCDTLQFPLPGTKTWYIAENNFGEYKGYVSGNNAYGDLAKADYFDNFGDRGYIRGLILEFVAATRSLTNDININFHIWKNDGEAGSPGTVQATVFRPISSLIEDVMNERPTILYFNQPVIISGPFYAGVVLPQITGDTLALYTNTDGDSNPSTAWEQHASQQWYAYNNSEVSWDLDLSHAIYPVVCGQVGMDENTLSSQVTVYPNPATGKCWILLDKPLNGTVKVKIFNTLGEEEKSVSLTGLSGESIPIDMSGLPKGLKMIQISAGDESTTSKMIVQ